MKNNLLGLLNLLEEEFQNTEGIRVSPVFPSGTQRSIDLVQDYDPESNTVHRESGVRVRTPRKEFFFPEDWFSQLGRVRIHRQIEEIREYLG